MAPNLSKAQYTLILDMLAVNVFTCVQITDAAECDIESVRRIRRNIRYFGTGRAPENVGGISPSLTPPMFDALYEHLLEKPDQYLEEMSVSVREAHVHCLVPVYRALFLSATGLLLKTSPRRFDSLNPAPLPMHSASR